MTRKGQTKLHGGVLSVNVLKVELSKEEKQGGSSPTAHHENDFEIVTDTSLRR